MTISHLSLHGSANRVREKLRWNVENLAQANGQPLVEILAGKVCTSRYYVIIYICSFRNNTGII